ncbi:MAG TPA: hypothetical protein VGB46_00110 [Flavisolibacter sp.]|jgi:hypothetical protein
MSNIPFYITSPRFTYALILLSLSICVLVIADSFLVPCKATQELVQELNTGRSGFRRSSGAAYSVSTEHSWLLIPEELYWKIHPYSVVQVERSSITGAQKRLTVYEGNHAYTLGLDYIQNGFGKYLLLAIMVAGSILTIFFKRIDNQHRRSNLCIALLVVTGFLVFQYLDFLFLFG